jgi:hypothetical protein
MMEESLLFANLVAVNAQERSQAIETLRAWAKKDGPRLRVRNLEKMFLLIKENLTDTNWNVRRDALSLLTDLIPQMPIELQGFSVPIIEAVMINLGDTKVAIRKAAILSLEVSSCAWCCMMLWRCRRSLANDIS